MIQRARTHQIAGYDIGEEYLSYLETAFNKADADSSGSLGPLEIQQMWRNVFWALQPKDVMRITDDIHQDLDPNKDGQVSWPELESFFQGKATMPTEIDDLIQVTTVPREPTRPELAWWIVDVDAPSYTPAPSKLFHNIKAFYSLITNLAIIVSILNFIIESIPEVKDPTLGDVHTSALFIIEAICIAIFTYDFIVRTMFTPSHPQYWSSYFTWIDILAILPFYIGISLGSNPSGGLVVLRVLRLLRLVRMLKLGRSLETVQVLIIAIMRVIRPLLVAMLGINAIAVTLFASLMFAVEKDEAEYDTGVGKWTRLNSSKHEDAGRAIFFQSIPDGMWWAWVTLTTVGYGDVYPVTGAGKLIASAAMVTGLVVMAFPLTFLSSSFAQTMSELQQKKHAQTRGRVFMTHLERHARPPIHAFQLGGATMGAAGGADARLSAVSVHALNPTGQEAVEERCAQDEKDMFDLADNVGQHDGSPSAVKNPLTRPSLEGTQDGLRAASGGGAGMEISSPLDIANDRHGCAQQQRSDGQDRPRSYDPEKLPPHISTVITQNCRQEESLSVLRADMRRLSDEVSQIAAAVRHIAAAVAPHPTRHPPAAGASFPASQSPSPPSGPMP